MNIGAQRFALYCGIAFPFIFFVFWGLIGGFMLPLPSPGDTAEQIRSYYTENANFVRLGIRNLFRYESLPTATGTSRPAGNPHARAALCRSRRRGDAVRDQRQSEVCRIH